MATYDVYIDGTLVIHPTDSMSKPSFTIRRQNEDGDKVISLTGDLLFTHAEYTYLYNKLVTDPNAVSNTVEIKFIDRCCGQNKEFIFLIKSENIRWCNGVCSITANATEYSENSRQYDCLKNTLIWDNWNNFQTATHPKLTYCIEFRPSILQDSVIILAIIINLILIILYPVAAVVMVIVTIINAIISFINFLGANLSEIDFDGDSSTNVLEEYSAFRDKLNEFMIGCGRKHPSPLVRDYIKNVCGKCGLTFTSSIFNDPSSSRYNTVYFSAPVTKGNLSTDSSNWIDKNKPLLNGYRFLNELKQAGPFDWKIINGVLFFERRDFFQGGNIWLDLTNYPDDKIISICYSWSRRQRFSYANLNYSPDAVDWVGTEAKDRWSDIVEWNNPYSPTQKDEYLRTLPYSSARFRDDGIERDVLSDYRNAPFVGPIIQQYDNVMLMNNGTSFLPKLLIWDPASGFDNSKVKNGYSHPSIPGVETYNLPWWIAEFVSGSAYTDFWWIENPRAVPFKGINVEAQIVYDCQTFNNFDIDGLFTDENGNASTQSIEINNQTGIMTIKGEI